MRTGLAALLLLSCAPSSASRTSVPSPAEAPAHVEPASTASSERTSFASNEAETAAPVESRIEFGLLEVPDFSPAVIAVPSGDAVLPLVVAAHGAGDTPEAQCEVWSALVRDRAIVLCPRGVALRRGADAYFYRNHHELEREFLAALSALRQRFGPRLAEGRALYTGYSQGATMGALMIGNHAGEFRRLVLVEGGFDVWNLARARQFQRAGGERVLLVCGTGHCRDRAKKSIVWLEKAGVSARLEFVEGGGHAYWGKVADRVLETLDWVL